MAYEFKPLEDGSVEFIPIDPTRYYKIPEDTINLVPLIKEETSPTFPSYLNENHLLTGEECLREMGQVCVEEYKIDRISRATWEENTAAALKLFTGFAETKNYPWKGASNVILPFLTIGAVQFHSRALDALIPSKEIVKCIDLGAQEPTRVKRVEAYMNYQLLYEMEEFAEGMDKSILQEPIEGSVFRKTYRDHSRGTNVSTYVSAADLVVNYGAKSLESAKRKTHLLYLEPNDIRIRVKDGRFAKDSWDLGWADSNEELSSPIKEASDRIQGISSAPSDLQGKYPRTFLEMHRFWDINGDGIQEPYVITVDLISCKVVRITPRWEKLTNDTIVPIEYFTHYGFLPNPEGFYNLGLGALLRGLNEGANTIVNEVIDSGALANLQGGFVSKRAGIRKGMLTFKMGEWKEVDVYADDINKAIYNFDFKGPNQTLYSVLGMLYEYAKLVSSVSETMTGQLPSSDTPATTVLSLIEEGRKVFSSIHSRNHRAFKKELSKLARLNSLYLDESVYFTVIGPDGLPTSRQEIVGRADFMDRIGIVPVSDPTIISRAERVLKSQQVLQDVRVNPLTATDPDANYRATRRFYEALDVPNIDEILKPPQPPSDVPPEDENAQMMLERPANVLPDQDHLHHIEIHDGILKGPFADNLSPNARTLIDRHKLEHIAQLYLITQKGAIGGPNAGNGGNNGAMERVV